MTADHARLVKWGGVAVLLILAVFIAWQWQGWRAAAQAGTAQAARITCSCRYVEGRSAESCAQDLPARAARARLTEDAAAKRISAEVTLLGHASARFKPGYGCLMEPQ